MELERTIAAGDVTEELARTLAGSEGPDPGESIAQGVSLGRYMIVGRLGEGGMGVVFAAYDPELDRRVALKLLSRGRDDDDARRRMLREAQAMARLQHPNVVTVYDVGTADERVWLAMEHVRGVTLRQWLARESRPWQQVLDVMRSVGRGLAAAHEAGLVHRDVKPENVMIGEDGRVLVMDFGLARADEVSPEPVPLELSGPSLLGSPLTNVGSLLGTPLYMAPEQLAMHAVDARADQFAWCVTCWEALFGERPFAGETLEELRRNIRHGRRRTPPRRGVPGGVVRALERGLALAPARRHPSMLALLRAIDAALRRRRWWFAGYTALVLSLGAGVAYGVGQARAAALADRCAAAGEEIRAVWGDAPARKVAAAFAATGHPDAAETLARARPWLDRYADAWARARTEQCVASGGPEPRAAGRSALECLEERRASLDALIEEVFAKIDREGMRQVVGSAARLPAISLCLDAGWLVRSPRRPEDPAVRQRVVELWARLARGSMLERAGSYDDAVKLAAEVASEADEVGWSPLREEARAQQASALSMQAQYAEAERILEDVVIQAAAEGNDRVAATAASQLAFAVGEGLGRPDEGLRWGRLALALLRRIGEDESLTAADTFAVLGIVEEGRGRYTEGLHYKERALTLRERQLGPDHPSVGTAYSLIGVNHVARGDIRAALRAHERGLAIRREALGPDHLEVGSSLLNLGNVYLQAGDYARASELYRESRRIFEVAYGPEHPTTVAANANISLCQMVAGDYAGALANAEEALRVREKALGPEHPLVAFARVQIGDVMHRRGDIAVALVEHRRALEILEKALGPEHQNVAIALYKLADDHLVGGESATALPLIERAMAIIATREVAPYTRAAVEFKLGQVMWEAGVERPRARALLAGALARLLGGEQDPEIALDEVRQWLGAHDEELRLGTVSLRSEG